MDVSTLTDQLKTTLTFFALIAGPPLGAALLVGLLVGMLQAATQIQDQTLPMTFKLLAVFGTLMALAGTLFPPLLAHTQLLLDEFPAMTRG